MDNNLTELENRILELREIKGYTIEETIKTLKINNKTFKATVERLKDKGFYNAEKIKEAMKKKNIRNKAKQRSNNPKLDPKEEDYRKKCIDFMCRRYFEYNETGRFNPLLVSKIQNLNKITSYRVIYNTMLAQQRNLDYANIKLKNCSSDLQKINYMLAIVKNNLGVTYKKLKKKDMVQEAESKQYDVQDMLRRLDKKTVSKPTEKIDMSQWFD